jgi:hypothetical protein
MSRLSSKGQRAAALHVDRCKSGETILISIGHTTSTSWLDAHVSGRAERVDKAAFVRIPTPNGLTWNVARPFE